MGNATPDKPKTAAAGRVLVKYMGSAHIATLESNEDFGGRFPARLGKNYTFDASNNFVVDMSEASPQAVELLLEDSERFKNVTDLKRVPSNLNQKIFGGHRGSEDADTALPDPEA